MSKITILKEETVDLSKVYLPMISANELRKGNWVHVDEPGNAFLGDTKLSGFCRLDSYGIYLIDSGASECPVNPILLTPEILGKAGFENRYDDGIFYFDRFHYNIESKDVWFDTSTIDCKYVHQLQNLYFALTREELEINL